MLEVGGKEMHFSHVRNNKQQCTVLRAFASAGFYEKRLSPAGDIIKLQLLCACASVQVYRQSTKANLHACVVNTYSLQGLFFLWLRAASHIQNETIQACFWRTHFNSIIVLHASTSRWSFCAQEGQALHGSCESASIWAAHARRIVCETHQAKRLSPCPLW